MRLKQFSNYEITKLIVTPHIQFVDTLRSQLPENASMRLLTIGRIWRLELKRIWTLPAHEIGVKAILVDGKRGRSRVLVAGRFEDARCNDKRTGRWRTGGSWIMRMECLASVCSFWDSFE